MNAVWKWSKVKDLPNVWNREKIIREEIERRKKKLRVKTDASGKDETSERSGM